MMNYIVALELAKLVAGVRAAHLKALELFLDPMQLHVLQKGRESAGPVSAGAIKKALKGPS